jgi:hypothetical protein
MRRLTLSVAFAGLALLATTPAATLAQLPGIDFGIAAGANVPTEDFGDAAQPGLVLNAFLGLRTGGPLGVRGALFWSRSDIDNPLIKSNEGVTLPDNSNLDVTGNVDLIGGSLDLTLGRTHGLVQPYVVGGVGVFRRRVKQDVSGAVTEFNDLRHKDTDVGFNGGVGLRISLGTAAVFAEARYYSVSTEPDRTNFVPVVVGLTF